MPAVPSPVKPGSIPARAGETGEAAVGDGGRRVYPRTGGGNSTSPSQPSHRSGLSPHGRGKPSRFRRDNARIGSIPARAGETYGGRWGEWDRGVYPRTGGGNPGRRQQRWSSSGLSPHGRGKQPTMTSITGSNWSIPARAGETAVCQLLEEVYLVYPRTGGGNGTVRTTVKGLTGLSPHGRGKLGVGNVRRGWRGSIPARAGETFGQGGGRRRTGVYPRTGGGNYCEPFAGGAWVGLSPHGRGKPGHNDDDRRVRWSIPARAGETCNACHSQKGAEVYPRTGGGNGGNAQGRRVALGLSPHGRGKLPPSCHPLRLAGSIPARAGETLR